MQSYLIRRILLFIPTVFIVTIIVFLLMRLVPGDVVELMVMQHGAEQEAGSMSELNVQVIKEMMGLDKPIHIQYINWVGDIFLHGSLGKSLWSSSDVLEEIMNRLPVTFQLGLMGMIIAQLIAIPVGIISAIRQDTWLDYLFRGTAILLIAMPGFWLGTMITVYPSIWWNWSPPMELVTFGDNPIENLKMFILPAIVLGINLSGTTMRMTRTMMLEVLRQDYTRTAWAKGLRERAVVLRHALKNALIPVVTMIGLYLPVLVGGTVVIEQLFCLPGMGRLVVRAITVRDYPIVSGVNLVVASFVMVAILLTDMAYAWLDPRIRFK